MYGVLTEVTPTGRMNMEVVNFEGHPGRYGRYEVMRNSYETDDIMREFEYQMRRRYERVLSNLTPFLPDPTPPIKKVIFNDPATIVIWSDNTKTVVKCQPGDTYDKELGLALCIAKKYLGNKGNFNEVFKKWIPEETISVEDMRERLRIYCHTRVCSTCPLASPVCRCGNNCHFATKFRNGNYTMTDDEVRDAYKIVFGYKED